MKPPIVAEELELLESVNRSLEEQPGAKVPSEAPIVEELRRLREQLVANPESKDAMSLNEQWHRQNALLTQLRVNRAAPQIDPRSPYFGHLRLEEDGKVRDLCLGRATCIQRGVRIVDWRNAPVSRLFYRYAQGEEYEEEIAGHLRIGEVVARRTVAIREGGLERVEAPEGVYALRGSAPAHWEELAREASRLAGGERTALRVHRSDDPERARFGVDGAGVHRRVDKRLPEITSLIDPEQFSLITRPAKGFLAIRGAAGSGKTTVALHRIAYLAYDDPQIDSKRTLFLVFSAGLCNYVGYVLPSLGVGNVAIRTWPDWAAEQRRRHFPRLPAEVRQDAPAAVQQLKLHPTLAVALAEQVARVGGPATAEQALDDWASVLTQRELLADVFAEATGGATRASALAEFVDWNRRQLDDLFAWLSGDREVQAGLEPEDDALLLRAYQLRVGPLGGRKRLRYRHAVVDEVQDFAPIEIQVLLDCLDDNRSLTLAGDTQQHLAAGSGFTSWAAFLQQLGVPGTELETLRVSYRSSREIMEFANGVLGPLLEDDAPVETKRVGPPVDLFRFSDHGACVAFLSDALRQLADEEPLASVAVLTPSSKSSELYAEGLAAGDVPRLRRIVNQEFTFAPGVEVTEIEQVKGLEFDYVVLVEVSAHQFPKSDVARRRLHVAATRAIHQLWISCVGRASPLVESVRA
ncbi:MAG: ATP-binding domain-containing protein [Deltaproteobacteria bacterium]|nr:ATP-binding domain-containing protein [Deltaproteobacteria bacterium]